MKLTVVTGSAVIKWHTLNDVFEAFYNQSDSKCEIQLACIVSSDPGIEHSKHASVLSAMFKFSVRQSLTEKKYSTILQTRRNVLKIVLKLV